jgi:HTH-type transcriptional regulator/antitoxin HigA
MDKKIPANRSAKESEDFSVLPNPSEVALPIYEMFKRLTSDARSKDLLKRMPPESTASDFLLKTAINSVEMTPALFRKNKTADTFLTSSWLSLTRERAIAIVVSGVVSKYKTLSLDDLRSIAVLSERFDQLPQISETLARTHGIVLVFEQAFAGMKTDGCVFKLRNGIPVIGLSLRYNRYDYFWFTLMHELSHIALHYDRLDEPIVDDLDEDANEEVEAEANQIAAESLVPRNIWRRLLLHQNSTEHLYAFSKEARTHPSIAAGMLRKRINNFAIFSDLVHSIDVKKELGIFHD